MKHDSIIPAGWTAWNGGENPVPAGGRVLIRLRNGKSLPLAPLHDKGLAAAFLSWAHRSSEADIVAYRVVSLPVSAALTHEMEEVA